MKACLLLLALLSWSTWAYPYNKQVEVSVDDDGNTQTANTQSAPYRSYYAKQNVNGGELQHCSSSGMALTGFTRDGYCTVRNDDAGSHHICIDLKSTAGGNFCLVTGQPNWCDSKMPCHDDYRKQCSINHWCVCQWAFRSYLRLAGGCDNIQTIVCEATNMAARRAYENHDDPGSKAALACLKRKCGFWHARKMTGSPY